MKKILIGALLGAAAVGAAIIVWLNDISPSF